MPGKKTTPAQIKIIVIDPGHGGKDPGCHGETYKEKDVALAVALKLGNYLEQNLKNVTVIYTRKTDVFVELEDRALIANKANADLFISIHCNAAGRPLMVVDKKTGKKKKKMYKNSKGRLVAVEEINPVPFGTETYVMGIKNEEGKMQVATRENSAIFYEEDYEKKYGGFDPESVESYIIMSNYTSSYVVQSANVASKIQSEYFKKAGRIDKGVRRQSIWVLWRTAMPSILTEIGYLTNPLEEGFLGSEKGQDYLAMAIFRGLRNYKDEVENTKTVYNDVFENQPALQNENLLVGNLPNQKKTEEEGEEKNNSSAETIQVSATDSVLSTQQIALRYKDKIDSINSQKKEILKDLVVKKEDLPKTNFIFKVLFASSPIALDLKTEKYSVIKNGSFYLLNGIYKYSSGNFNLLEEAVAHKNLLRENGFKDCFVACFKDGLRFDIIEAKRLLGL